ncbi:MAG: nucleotidyltransferase domain-containing protein [candidate division KSB1 bacterium]|nr:nucleotidyltransferase domain-containing protein [candidate division KSB1 bacterium]
MRVPKNPEDIFDDFSKDWRDTFHSQVQSIILYGSAARGDYVPRKSDINFLIVLSAEAMKSLRKAIPLVQKWRKKAVSAPLLLTWDYIQHSLDSFPIEFLSMKLHHRTIFGEDVLEDLQLKPEHVRLQLEREFKGKLLHLREGLLIHGDHRDNLLELLYRSMKAFLPLFEGFLYLHGETVPVERQELVKNVVARVQGNAAIFEDVFKAMEQKTRLHKEELLTLFEGYIDEIERIANYVDQIDS